MIICGLEFPDRCPKDCPLQGDFALYGQSSLCGRCPVFVCGGEFVLVEPEEWHKFFTDGTRPCLPLQKKEK